MKILLATSSVTPAAGIPSYNKEVCSMLCKENEIHLLVDEKIDEYPGYAKIMSLANINQSSYKECLQVLLDIKAEDYDLIINSNSHLMARLAPFIGNETKLITISHSLRYTDSDNAAFNNKYVDNIVALSGYCKKYLEKKFRIVNKISVIYNFVADNPNSFIIRENKKKNKPLKIVYAGGSAPSKSPELVLDIVRHLQKTSLSFEFYWMSIKTPPLKRIQPFDDVSILIPEDDRIIFTGMIPRDAATNLIAESNIFLAPSRREGCPMALLEALCIGTISIVSDYNIANKEIIRDTINGFVINHRDVDAFVNRISDIILNHQKYLGLYDIAYLTFKEELSYSVWRRKMLELISEGEKKHNKRRTHMSYFLFKWNEVRFKIMHYLNMAEMVVREIIPSAWPIYKMYKKVK